MTRSYRPELQLTQPRSDAHSVSLRLACGQRLWSGRRREELQRNSVWVAEGDTRAVVGVHDSAMGNAQLVQACDPGLQLTAVTAGEGNMIQAGAMLVESVTCGIWVRMQAEQLSSAEREHGVVKAPDLLVLVENGLGGQQPAVPAGASLQISHSHSDVGDGWKLRHVPTVSTHRALCTAAASTSAVVCK